MLAVNVAAVATPLAFVVAVVVFVWLSENVPLAPLDGAVNVTTTPSRGAEWLSSTVACSAVLDAVPMVTVCGVPAVAAIDAGVPVRFVREVEELYASPEAGEHRPGPLQRRADLRALLGAAADRRRRGGPGLVLPRHLGAGAAPAQRALSLGRQPPARLAGGRAGAGRRGADRASPTWATAAPSTCSAPGGPRRLVAISRDRADAHLARAAPQRPGRPLAHLPGWGRSLTWGSPCS